MVIKKVNVLLILFILIFSFGKGQKSNIYIAPIDATTPYSISCSNLLDAFPDKLKKIELNNRQSGDFSLLIRCLKSISKEPYVNIRFKGEIYFNKQSFSFCGDQATININGQYYEMTKELFEYIKKLRRK